MVCKAKVCGALTLAGTHCKLCVTKGHKYCHLHSVREKASVASYEVATTPTKSQAAKMVDDPAARSRPPNASANKGRPGRTVRSPRPTKSQAAKMVDDPAARSRPPNASANKDRPGRAMRQPGATGVAGLAPIAADDGVTRRLVFESGW